MKRLPCTDVAAISLFLTCFVVLTGCSGIVSSRHLTVHERAGRRRLQVFRLRAHL
jgi:uncharacterized protein (DUF3084 family)